MRGVEAGRGVHRGLAILPALISFSCIIPFAGPPARMDFGAAHAFRDDEQTGFHFAIGLHTASLGPETIPKSDLFDVGAGFTVDVDHDGTRGKGFYGSGEWFVMRRKWFRVGAGLRASTCSRGRTGDPARTRACRESSTEWDTATVTVTGTAAASCSLGAAFRRRGSTSRAARQHLPDGREAFVATVGMSFRLPALAGILIIIPGCNGG